MNPKDYMHLKNIKDKLYKYKWFMVFKGDYHDRVNDWLRPMLNALDNSKNHEFLKNFKYLGVGANWFVKKEKILELLFANEPLFTDEVERHDFMLMYNDIWDYILDYDITNPN